MQGNVFWMTLRDFPCTIPNKAALEYARANQKELFDAFMASPITNPRATAIKNSHRVLDVGGRTRPLRSDLNGSEGRQLAVAEAMKSRK